MAVTVAMAALAGGVHQPLDLGLDQVFGGRFFDTVTFTAVGARKLAC
jgi:hypothetical protein